MESPVTPRILALTVTQPWAWALAAGHKPFENRDWLPWDGAADWLAIHAGLGIKSKRQFALDREWLAEAFDLHPTDEELVRGAVVAVCRISRVVDAAENDPINRSPWRSLQRYAWVIDGLVRIRPVPCKGHERLWALDEDVLGRVREEYRAARAA
jgi:hypothetical protein